MDRRRNGRTWRFARARRHPRELWLHRLQGRGRGGTLLPQPAASRASTGSSPHTDTGRVSRIARRGGAAVRHVTTDRAHARRKRICAVATLPFCTEPDALAHFTSAPRYPVFFNGKNFNGQVDLTRSPPLARLLDRCLAEEAAALSGAIWVPAGPKAGIGLHYLVEKGLLRSDRILAGLPHPSTANNERVHYFIDQKAKAKLSIKTNSATIDAT